ncbi:hypothetical protein N9924_00270 [bacterium]|nr:hypothetical protein [bacterium]
MIVKIENKDQEKYILECAEKDGFVWTGGGEDPTEWSPSKRSHSFPFKIDYCDILTIITLKDSNTTFEQFKAQKEEPIKTDLEKENEELKKVIDDVRLFCKEITKELKHTSYEQGAQYSCNTILTKLPYEPNLEQDIAKSIIREYTPRVLEELKKLL